MPFNLIEYNLQSVPEITLGQLPSFASDRYLAIEICSAVLPGIGHSNAPVGAHSGQPLFEASPTMNT
jgi:hypothetical protein